MHATEDDDEFFLFHASAIYVLNGREQMEKTVINLVNA